MPDKHQPLSSVTGVLFAEWPMTVNKTHMMADTV